MKGILLLCFAVFGLMSLQSGQPSFTEYQYNPVFSPGRAYYPTVIFDANHFGDTYTVVPFYKMWYSAVSGIALAYSQDGVTWYQYGAVSGLLMTAHHAHVIYDVNGFGGTAIRYKMWFWDTAASIYSLDALKYAESADGINWSWSTLTQDAGKPLVTNIFPDWNRGTYGPTDVFYNPAGSPTLDDTTLWNNRYVMYYDGTTGGIEQVGLGYSSDGLHWKRYGDQPVLQVTPGAWDSNYVGFGTVVKILDQYHFFYSGGQNAMHEGIGYASSPDGITWSKAGAPLFHVTDGVPWRSVRCYTPSVVLRIMGGTASLHMWFTGDDGTTRAIGYALGTVALPAEGTDYQNAERKIQRQMIPLARFNFSKCCEKNEETVGNLLSLVKDEKKDTPEYREALDYLERACWACSRSSVLTASGNAVAGNRSALEACDLYAKAIEILEKLTT